LINLEYWDHRTGNGIIPCAVTRIPEIPSQSRFLERWNHFYDQYWRLREEGASTTVINTYQEPWRDVDPGRLPRTRDEIRLGYGRSQYEMMIDSQQQHALLDTTRDLSQTPHISLEDAIDQLLNETDSEAEEVAFSTLETNNGNSSLSSQESRLTITDQENQNTGSIPGYPEPLGTRLRQWPNRILSILADSDDEDIDSLPPPISVSNAINLQNQVDQSGLVNPVESSSRMDEFSAEDSLTIREQLRYRQQQRRTEETQTQRQTQLRNLSIYSPPRDLEDDLAVSNASQNAQENDLATPQGFVNEIAGTLAPLLQEAREARAIDNVQRAVELIGAQSRAMFQESERMIATLDRALEQDGPSSAIGLSPDAHASLQRLSQLSELQQTEQQQRNEVEMLEEMLQSTRQHLNLLRRREQDAVLSTQISRFSRSHQRLGLDSLPRPEALKDDQMTVKLECGICLQQIANVACLPCGHVVMCEW
jgi:hypothetical protein